MIARTTAGALMVMACTAVPPEAQLPEAEVPVHGAGKCAAGPVQDLIGRRRSDAVGADALRRSGAKMLRWIGPDTAYTQDLRSDRINLEIDRSDRVTGIRCF
jgi:hypothetical protein